MDLAYISAAELAGLIRGRTVSPVEVMRVVLVLDRWRILAFPGRQRFAAVIAPESRIARS